MEGNNELIHDSLLCIKEVTNVASVLANKHWVPMGGHTSFPGKKSWVYWRRKARLSFSTDCNLGDTHRADRGGASCLAASRTGQPLKLQSGDTGPHQHVNPFPVSMTQLSDWTPLRSRPHLPSIRPTQRTLIIWRTFILISPPISNFKKRHGWVDQMAH